MRATAFLALAWLPFLLLWAVLNVVYFDTTFSRAIIGATSAIGSAAVLGVGVWFVTGRLRWPDGAVSYGFYLVHLALAGVYSAAWIGWGVFVLATWRGISMSQALADSPMVGWRFVTGVWLYGLLAGASYALRLRRRLLRQRRRALRAEALASRSRLSRIRAQLLPHFLFNALHSVSSLMATDVDEAQNALEQLGDMLRYTLDDGADLVPLEREWRFANDYLAIERLRLDGELRVDARWNPRAASIGVPPFCLQTLVENAVRHGVVAPDGGGRLSMLADLVDGEIVLTVRDDGPGADPETIDAGNGRGLRLLRETLAARWGESARMEIATLPGNGFSCTVRMPADGAEA
jgi:hypothetical protein